MWDRVFNFERCFQIVREHYLRDDIGCGSKVCKKCKHNDEKPLEENTSVVNTGFSDKHYLLVDTNVVLHQVLYVFALIIVCVWMCIWELLFREKCEDYILIYLIS